VRGGTKLEDHMCWTTGGQVGSCEHHILESKANLLCELKAIQPWG